MQEEVTANGNANHYNRAARSVYRRKALKLDMTLTCRSYLTVTIGAVQPSALDAAWPGCVAQWKEVMARACQSLPELNPKRGRRVLMLCRRDAKPPRCETRHEPEESTMRQNKFASVGKPLALLAAGALMLMSANVARADAPTVVITDDSAPHGPVTRFEQFSTQLTASVQNPPTDTDEIKIEGPTYKWSTSGAGLHLTSTTNNPNNLESAFPPSYGGIGDKSANVYCTATFTLTNKKDNTALTPITVSGPAKEVKFFVRVPVEAKQTDADKAVGQPNSNGPTKVPLPGWGHTATYNFEVRDNQPIAQLYGKGKIDEKFLSYSPDSRYAADLARQGAPGTEYSYGPTDTFTDYNAWYTNPKDAPIWSYGSIGATGDKNGDDPWFSFNQLARCVEQSPPYQSPPVFDQPTDLKPSFTVTHRRDFVERH